MLSNFKDLIKGCLADLQAIKQQIIDLEVGPEFFGGVRVKAIRSRERANQER